MSVTTLIKTCVLPLLAVLTTCSASVFAHPDPFHRIEQLSVRIRETPDSASLYLKRASLYLAVGRSAEAVSDLRTVRVLAPEDDRALLLLGRAHLESGDHLSATTDLDAYLTTHPRDTIGLTLRARAHAARGDSDLAALDYRKAFSASKSLSPQTLIEFARAVSDNAGPSAGVELLDRAGSELGFAISLEEVAFELELEDAQYAQALARVERVLETLPRNAVWRFRKGRALALTGRATEAAETYRTAIVHISSRETKASRSPALEALVRGADIYLAEHGDAERVTSTITER